MLWTFELKLCVSAVKLNAERAADDFHLNAHATIVYIYIYIHIYIYIYTDENEAVNTCKDILVIREFLRFNYELSTLTEHSYYH